ncbi:MULTISPECIES: Nif3-like dinuclear metal center hexameric protein [unclassified Paenibacillus]|uniref:Nif3-like dinuclear metal center hexameric protein n=1 Tax=unclassified Paenibacillus TaxID=185978 RepID=UPI0009A8C566|nr:MULTISPECIES: Nif3-like dinuclear metal center hexameric protein [unclassified Paenibacillus]SLJ95565.1 Putative GTP cyclohydrolase 1 type 2, NIF3 family [Paenibacillus sp. RU5A]SOC67301.1 Putative GTP cyclohydrolase 1 type 2, NIF3 family [Paenibacillus sp. RU26A]SOC69339.1 Putative GTP cyclohydrolase 1 type 2, NIF3 family [Paenibacillus sp. RU5M]
MNITIQDIIQHLTENVELPEHTVDQLITGSPHQTVTGVFVTFMPTQHVIEHAIQRGANLIIAHEPPFYNHHSHTDWLADDPVYETKRTLIDNGGIAIYRCHDAIHRFQPDGITEGLVQALGWSPYVVQHKPEADILSFPEGMTVQLIAEHIKRSLGIEYIRLAGDPRLVCRQAAVLVGFRGNGNLTIPLLQQEELDLIIAGEGFEWETPEYIRDAVQQGKQKALLMIGHAESEASGMKLLSERLATAFAELPVHFIGEQPVFQVL